MTNLYNSAVFFDQKVEELITMLTNNKQHFRIPIDLEIKVPITGVKWDIEFEDCDGEHTYHDTYFEGYTWFKCNFPIKYFFHDACSYGMVVVEQNPRFWGIIEEGEESTLQEIPVDDPILLETLVQIIDNAGRIVGTGDDAKFSECKNVWKSIKPYKEMHIPVALHAIPLDYTDVTGGTGFIDDTPIPVDARDYGVRIQIHVPKQGDKTTPIPEYTDAGGDAIWTPTETMFPFVEVVEKVILLLKPESGTQHDQYQKFPECFFKDFEPITPDIPAPSCLPRQIGGL